jgi:hypothetical protein
MSMTALITAVFLLIVILAQSYWINARYRLALTSVQEKQGGVISYYRGRLAEVFLGKARSTEHIVCLVHYLLVHLFTPFFLSAFLLHTDGNFLIAVGSIIVSLHLIQRVYPAEPVL